MAYKCVHFIQVFIFTTLFSNFPSTSATVKNICINWNMVWGILFQHFQGNVLLPVLGKYVGKELFLPLISGKLEKPLYVSYLWGENVPALMRE